MSSMLCWEGDFIILNHTLTKFIYMYLSTALAQVPQPPEVLPSALTATSANLTWSCPLEKDYTVVSYFVFIIVDNSTTIDPGCLNGQNFSYSFTVPQYQRYVNLQDQLLSKI